MLGAPPLPRHVVGDDPLAFDAFISYSHAADGLLAPAVKRGLERLGRPWSQSRALHVFRDVTDLGVNPDLWSSITTVMEESSWFVLLASPDAAASPRVNQEIEYWCAHKDPKSILVVLTDGQLEWDSRRGDFNRETSTALPAALMGRFANEPLYLDLRWARDATQLDLRHSRFRDAIASLAAPMHGLAKDELESEDVRQYRKTIRYRRAAISTIVLLFVGLVVTTSALYAITVRNNADRKTKSAQVLEQRAVATARRAQHTLSLEFARTAASKAQAFDSVTWAANTKRFADSQSRQVIALQAEVERLKRQLASCKARTCS